MQSDLRYLIMAVSLGDAREVFCSLVSYNSYNTQKNKFFRTGPTQIIFQNTMFNYESKIKSIKSVVQCNPMAH
jgi:hypothetical protein